MKITLGEKKPLRWRPKLETKENFKDKLSDKKVDYANRLITQSLVPVEEDLVGDHYHTNYLDYLSKAWANHYGVVVTPDLLWYSLLCEATGIVASDPNRYRSLFTETEEKQQITVQTGSPTILPLDLIISHLKKLVPSDATNFLPEFTTTTDRARSAFYAAFADMVSPYYNYAMFCCDIPFVDVRGTKEDYQKLANSWKKVGEILGTHKEYFQNTVGILNSIVDNLENPEFWKDMFSMERCGSGSQYVISGWFSDLFVEQPSFRQVCNFSTHISRVNYKNLSTDIEYQMVQGIFSSKLTEEEFLEPDFGMIVYEKHKVPKSAAYDPYKTETCYIGAN